MRPIFVFAILLSAAGAFADSVDTNMRTVTKLSEGVYEIRHPDAPDDFPQGNTTVVIGDRDVLVVDSCYLPSSAQEDIDQIRKWTDKPVRFLVNTHWHNDHVAGNATYAAAFPDLTIIAHEQTRQHIAGYISGWKGRFAARTAVLEGQLKSGNDADGKPLTDEGRADVVKSLAGRAKVWAELTNFRTQAPTAGFDRSLDLDLGNREVQIRFLGRGNTSGDAVVYLPAEKILVAGDLLDAPVPYLGGGYPVDEIETLKAMDRFEINAIVPGHGDVMHDKNYLHKVTNTIQTVVDEVRRQIYQIGNGSRHLEEVRAAVMQAIDFKALRAQFVGDDKNEQQFFDNFSMSGLITAAYAQLWSK
jgi:cyclase